MSEALLNALRQSIGAPHVLTGGDLSAYEQDWRKRYRGHALAVVRPGHTDEVAQVVKNCAAHGVSLVPQGGNTGLVGGSVPNSGGQQVLLNLGRLNRVRELDATNLTLTAEAGCILKQVQDAASEHALLFPLSMASEGSCTIGGNLATNAGGTQVLRYGNARELCLGLEVVTAQGEVWHGLKGLRKDNTGYDLRDLLIGSEGTLAIITAATLKLFPQPAARCTALAALPSLDAALELLHLARQQLASHLTGFEVMNALSLALVAQHFPQIPQGLAISPWKVLLELSEPREEASGRALLEKLLAQTIEAGWVSDAVVAQNLHQSNQLWHLRESIPLAQAQEGLNIKHDIALPISRIPAFVAHTDALLARHADGIRLVNFGHLGDGNLHYNVQAPKGNDPAAFLQQHEPAVNHIVYEAVTTHGGSISAEHGIGQLKREALLNYQSPVAMQMMLAIKQALDPQGVMNPGRVV
ncbi:MAG: FAD-binding oxidoreductase [Rhizobacter sp.]